MLLPLVIERHEVIPVLTHPLESKGKLTSNENIINSLVMRKLSMRQFNVVYIIKALGEPLYAYQRVLISELKSFSPVDFMCNLCIIDTTTIGNLK